MNIYKFIVRIFDMNISFQLGFGFGFGFCKQSNINIHYRNPVAYKVKKNMLNYLVDEINKNKKI